MAYDGEVRIDTALDTAGIERGVKDAEKKVNRLQNAFDRANLAVKRQEALIASLTRQVAEAADRADDLKYQLGESSTEFKEAERNAERLSKNLEKNTRELEILKSKADIFADAIEKAAEEYKELSDKKVELEIEGVQNAAKEIKEIGVAAQKSSAISIDKNRQSTSITAKKLISDAI